jgi:hypothetical protein
MKLNPKSEKNLKKAQIEMMGLLVIVILITIILFFVLMFSLRKPPKENDISDFKRMQAIKNFGTTTIETTVDCDGRIRTIRELLVDCAFLKEINCREYNSCDSAKNNLTFILNNTLDIWGYDYQLKITKPGGSDVIEPVGNGCANARNSKAEPTPIGTAYYGSLSFSLRTC